MFPLPHVLDRRERRRRIDQKHLKNGVNKVKHQDEYRKHASTSENASGGCDSDSVADSTNASALETSRSRATDDYRRMRSQTEDTITEQTHALDAPLSGLGALAPISRVPLFHEGKLAQRRTAEWANQTGVSQTSGEAVESQNQGAVRESNAAALMQMFDTGHYGSAEMRPWGISEDEWGSQSAKIWHQQGFGTLSAASQKQWASAGAWYGHGGQQSDVSGHFAGPEASETGGFSTDGDMNFLGEATLNHQKDLMMRVSDEWKENPAKMIMMGVEVMPSILPALALLSEDIN